MNGEDISRQKYVLLLFLLNFSEGGGTGFRHGNPPFPSPGGEEHAGLSRCVRICVLCTRFSRSPSEQLELDAVLMSGERLPRRPGFSRSAQADRRNRFAAAGGIGLFAGHICFVRWGLRTMCRHNILPGVRRPSRPQGPRFFAGGTRAGASGLSPACRCVFAGSVRSVSLPRSEGPWVVVLGGGWEQALLATAAHMHFVNTPSGSRRVSSVISCTKVFLIEQDIVQRGFWSSAQVPHL